MSYDLEKYRVKREKVLGVKKRVISFGTLVSLVSLAIVVGLSMVVIPRSIAFFHQRHLQDAIYKVSDDASFSPDILQKVGEQQGVRNILPDQGGTRLVITFHHSETDPEKIASFFQSQGLNVILLNQVGHSQHMKTLKKEATFEAL